MPCAAELGAGQGDYAIHLLADEKHVYGAKVEVVKEWEGRQSVIGRMLAGIKLGRGAGVSFVRFVPLEGRGEGNTP